MKCPSLRIAVPVSLMLAAALLPQQSAFAVTYEVLHHFGSVANDGAIPRGSLVQDRFGSLYGTTATGGTASKGILFRLAGSRYTILRHFAGNPLARDGEGPSGNLVSDNLGNVYGTTEGGSDPNTFGSVFKWDVAKGFSTFYRFSFTDGWLPRGLTRDADGNLYGVTALGGDPARSPGFGTIYKISPTGRFTKLFSFNGTNGASSVAPLLRVGNVLYGTTVTGGSVSGNVFKINTDGTGFTVLQDSFPFGWGFSGGLTKHPLNSNLYGAAGRGGTPNTGGIYKVTAAGAYSFEYQFTGPNGAYPQGTLISDGQGNFYGTTHGNESGCVNGSGAGGYGTVFQYVPTATPPLTTLHPFHGTDGANPCLSELLRDASGNLYGVTQYGGTFNKGVLFRIRP